MTSAESDASIPLAYAPRPLTRRQRQFVRRIARWRTRPPTFLRMIPRILLSTAFILIGPCLVLLLTGGAKSSILQFVVGMACGVLIVNLSQIRLLASIWPAYDEIIDWSRVEVLTKIEGGLPSQAPAIS